MRRTELSGVAVAGWALLLTGCTGTDSNKPIRLFEDVTSASGLAADAGMTFGAAWGDYDGDGLPDLYVTNHLNEAALYRNLGAGRFADVTSDMFRETDLGGDKHGAAWADVDNDGKLDLLQLTGAGRGVGTEAKRLFMNRGEGFEDAAEALGVANPYGRTRMPLWLDLDRDGRLDLIQGAEARFDEHEPPFVFRQGEQGFGVASDALEFASPSVPFCIITELNGKPHPELVCRQMGRHGAVQVLDTATRPARALDLLPATAFEDLAAGDFDNDGAIDLFMARKNPAGPIAFGRPAPNAMIADVRIEQADFAEAAGFRFRAPGDVTFVVASTHPSDAVTPARIHIGARSEHPDALEFRVSPDGAAVGVLPPQPGIEAGVHVGFTPPDEWQVYVAAGPANAAAESRPGEHYQQTQIRITAAAPLASVEAVGPLWKSEEAPARLFMNRGGKLVEEGDKRGVNAVLVPGVNVVAGDFDNDMDLDLFVLASGDAGKWDDRLLLNRGNGRFDSVAAAGGAGGSRNGVGDSVTSADFNGDGFLDLFVATGGSMGRSLGLPSDAGEYRLYRNAGNDHHWLEIDLEGTQSNRDGIGAMVYVTAGGVTQMRFQDGGIHHRAQNHSRLHFGLREQSSAERVIVQWPSGIKQELTGVAADRLIRIVEARGNSGNALQPGNRSAVLLETELPSQTAREALVSATPPPDSRADRRKDRPP
jgi:hypothetical protein